jgi:hypothetical protein
MRQLSRVLQHKRQVWTLNDATTQLLRIAEVLEDDVQAAAA